MRPGHWLSFGTLVLVLAGCSSRGGESLFNGEAPPQDIEDEVDAGTERDAASDDEDDADVGGDEPDAEVETDAEVDSGDEEEPPANLPEATIACGNASCTAPEQYCCHPPANVNIPAVSASCKSEGEECRFGIGPVSSGGVPQHCSAHAHCAGGQCCAVRELGPNQQPQNRYERIECMLKCGQNDVEVCDPDNPQCSSGSCLESSIIRGLYVCRT